MRRYHSKEYIIREIKNGNNYIEIAKKNGVRPKTVHRWFGKFGLTKKHFTWTQKEIEILLKDYTYNFNVYKLFSERTKSAINHKAYRLGLKRVQRTGKYIVDSEFFNRWSPEMAYVLGWFYSDGNVSNDGTYCQIHLHKKDYKILDKINNLLNSSNPIRISKDSAQLLIYNKVLCRDLIRLGCIPKKSLRLKFPKIANKYISHFIRGYFDGDGSISIANYNTIRVGITGTKYFLKPLQKRLNETIGIKIRKLQRMGAIWRCNYYGNNARKLCNWMYKGSKNLSLDRKRKIFELHIKKGKNNA